MSKFLVIAEKPSVAQSYAKNLSAYKREDGYLEGESCIVSWCLGHLAEYAQPEEYDPKYEKWQFDDLPILPEAWKLKVSKDKKKQFDVLKGLMTRSDVEYLVNGCDAGREGELIFQRVYVLAGCRKPVKRLWISSMEDAAIQKGFQTMKSEEEYKNLCMAAVCRAQADWLIGMNGTRAYTTRYFKRLVVGRVQTPTLANELNERGIPTPGKFRVQRNEKIAWNRKVTEEEWLWDTRIVWMVLRNYAYTGALVQGKTSRIRVGGSETRRTKKNQQFITENHHKGIVTHEEFELAQLVIGNQKQKGFARDAGFSLKGKVKCGNCGLKMMYNYGAMPVVYCGHTAAVGSMSTCDKTRYSAAKIERIVLVALRKQLEIFQSMAKILEEGEEKNKTNLPAMQRNMEQELEKLKAERIRQYEAYAEGVVNQETYLKNKKDLNEKIEIIQDKYEQIQEVTSVEDDLMKDIRTVEKNAEEVNILKKMTRHIAETFVEEITIYDSEKIEIRFVFDDLLIGMADRIKKKTEDIA